MLTSGFLDENNLMLLLCTVFVTKCRNKYAREMKRKKNAQYKMKMYIRMLSHVLCHGQRFFELNLWHIDDNTQIIKGFYR